MPLNALTPSCLHRLGGAQLFMSPAWNSDQKEVRVQIVDVFALELATGYVKDMEGRLLLTSEPSVSAGRTWSLAKACQLVRNDKRPHRWVVLHRHKKAWGLFWAGGGLDLCRDELNKHAGAALGGALVPVTPEALLRLLLAMDEPEEALDPLPVTSRFQYEAHSRRAEKGGPLWRLVAFASLVCLSIVSALYFNVSIQLRQQSEIIKQLLEGVQ